MKIRYLHETEGAVMDDGRRTECCEYIKFSYERYRNGIVKRVGEEKWKVTDVVVIEGRILRQIRILHSKKLHIGRMD